jgi:hypothetical protein
VLITNVGLEPSAQGKRYKFARGRHAVTDGPFAESKELVAGYVMFRAASLEAAADWAPRYGAAVGCHELDLRTVEEDETGSEVR